MTGVSDDPRPTNQFQAFFRTEAAGGAVLVFCACAALAVANSPWAGAYRHVLEMKVAVDGGGHALSLTVHQWINDAIMAVFFLLVGLEIKREVLAGELSSPRQAALPIAGAIGGMVVPALIYYVANGGGAGSHGWAIPMATDIAFALGVLMLVAPRAPLGLKVFLAALAIVDDMGAVLVLAIFYTNAIAWSALGIAGLFMVLLVALNLLRVQRLTPYLLVGVGLWYFVHASGVHATIAGVLLAFAIPSKTRINAAQFSAEARRALDAFDRGETGDLLVLTSKGQQDAVFGLERAAAAVTGPLLRLEHALHGFSAFVVMPWFALSNAGVNLSAASGGQVTIAVILGLAVGKPLGITAAAVAAVRFRWASLPEGVTWTALHGCAWLAGIGFTMSLFIASVAFDTPALLDSAKVGILAGSLVSGVIGTIVIRRGTRADVRHAAIGTAARERVPQQT